MNKINLLIIGVIFLFLTISCSSLMKGDRLAEKAVENFHSQYNAGKYTEIYNQADDGFKNSVTEKQWLELAEKINRKLGTVKSAKSTGSNVKTTNAGTLATVTYDVDFGEGKGTEEFMFRITDDKALLYNYEVNSPLWNAK
jgi:Protein of unknown function (DUF4019)